MMTTAFDPIAQPYVEGLSQGELKYQRCAACGVAQKLARMVCAGCGSPSLEWRNSAGLGTVYAVTLVSRAPSDVFRPLAPYTLVLVDLDEGARRMGHAEPGIAIGERVSAVFFEHDGRTLLRFQRLGRAEDS